MRTHSGTAQTRPLGDASNAIATTQFVANALAGSGIPHPLIAGAHLSNDGTNTLWQLFLQNLTGSASRTWLSKAQDIVSLLDFPGIDPSGATDSSAGIQLAHNTGKTIYYPRGTYLITPGITIPSGSIVGDGPTQTIIISNDTGTANWYKFTGIWNGNAQVNAPAFRDFSMIANPSKTNGAGIQVLPASGESSYLDFRNCHFAYLPIGIDFVAASLWKIIGCDFLAYTVAGAQVANTNTGDSGDSVIADCVFNTPFNTGSGIFQKSSGGLKILGNKFLGGLRAYTMNLSGGPTGVLVICGNSMENFTSQGISLAQAVGGSTFVNAVIIGNEIASNDAAGIGTDASGFLSELVVSGNVFNIGGTTAIPCMFLNSVTDFIIDGNMMKGNANTGSSAINLTNCANGKIGVNTYANLPNPISITSSPTVNLIKDFQEGTVTTANTGWTGYPASPLFASPTVTVTFPRAFLVAPNPADFTAVGSSGLGEFGITGVTTTTTTASFKVVSGVQNIAAVMNWRCAGVL